MAKPTEHSFASASGTVAGETAKGGLGGGLMGALGGGVIAAGVLAAVTFGLGAAVSAMAALVGSPQAATAILGAATKIAGGAAIVGGTVGAIGGGLTGSAVGMLSGILGGGKKVREEEAAYYAAQKGKSKEVVANARAEAAEQYAQVGYNQGFQDGQVFAVNQIVSAQQEMVQQAAQAHQPAPGGFAAKEAKPCCKHTDKLAAAAAANAAAPAVPGL